MRIHVQQLLTLVLVVGTIMPGAGAYGVSQLQSPAATMAGRINPSNPPIGDPKGRVMGSAGASDYIGGELCGLSMLVW